MINFQNLEIRKTREKMLEAMTAGMNLEDKKIFLNGAADEILLDAYSHGKIIQGEYPIELKFVFE